MAIIRFKSMDQQPNNAKFSFQGFNKVLELDSRLRNIHNQEHFDPTDNDGGPPIPASPQSPQSPATDSNNEPKQCSSKDATTSNDNAQDIMQMDETMANNTESPDNVDPVNVPDTEFDEFIEVDSRSVSSGSSVQCLDDEKIAIILASQRERAQDVAKIKREPGGEEEEEDLNHNQGLANPPQVQGDSVHTNKSISPGPSRNSGDGENQQPTKEPDQDQDSHESTPPPPAPTMATMVSPQFCIFCPASFKTEKGYISHLNQCNDIMKKIADYKKRKCFICKRTIPHFNVTGMLRHAISCIILDREERLKQQTNDSSNASNNETRISKTEPIFVKPELNCSPQVTQNRPKRSSTTKSTKKPRTNTTSGCFTPEQSNALISFFKVKQYIDNYDKVVLAKQTGLSELQITRWFEMKRHRTKEQASSPSISVSNSDRSNSQKKKRKYNGAASSSTPTLQEKQQFSQWIANKRKRLDTGVTKVEVENIVQDDDDEEEESSSSSSNDSDSGDEYDVKMKRKSQSFAKISEKNLKILLNQFEQGPNPSVLDIVRMSSMTKLSNKTISAWFAKSRKSGNVKITKSGNKINATASPLITRGQAHSSPKVELADLEEDFYKEEEKSKVLKQLTIRQKLGTMKKVTGNAITNILNDYKDAITQILLMYADSDSSTKQALELEVVELNESLKTNNPFEAIQVGQFEQWEDDFVFGMYPETTDTAWVEIVNHFKEKILQVWTRVIVYSNALDMPLEEATMDIYHLMLARGQKDTTDVSWTMPNLLRQVRTIEEYSEDSDDDDDRE